MARLKKSKGTSGAASNYITRTHAVKKLQISLASFRRLCILKGIYPRDPSNKKKAGKGSTAPRTYYYRKDIQYLLHEPLVEKLREQKIHKRKVRKASIKGEWAIVKALEENKPEYRLDHIIKERYPNFTDALRDLDDALAMVFLFATLPSDGKVKSTQVVECQRLSTEFLAYIMHARALRKVFLSVKGIYYQIELQGQEITWIVPYKFTQHTPEDVDFKIMGTFLELYLTLLRFVNYKLHVDDGLKYPPKHDEIRESNDAGITSYVLESLNENTAKGELIMDVDEKHADDINKKSDSNKKYKSVNEAEMKERLAKVSAKLASIQDSLNEKDQQESDMVEDDAMDLDGDDDDENQLTSLKQLHVLSSNTSSLTKLFEGCVFWLSRETPRWSLEFVIRAFGGQVGWEDDSAFNVKSKFLKSDKKMGACAMHVNDSRITHHIVDRPMPMDGSVPSWMRFENRQYLQPQWIYDCINARRLLSPNGYRPSESLPPHLSPFVIYGEDDYKPDGAELFINNESADTTLVADEEAEELEQSKMTSQEENILEEAEAEKNKEQEEEVKSSHQPTESLKLKTPTTKEEKERALMMMGKKDRRLYQKIQFSKKRKSARVEALKQKKEQQGN